MRNELNTFRRKFNVQCTISNKVTHSSFFVMLENIEQCRTIGMQGSLHTHRSSDCLSFIFSRETYQTAIAKMRILFITCFAIFTFFLTAWGFSLQAPSLKSNTKLNLNGNETDRYQLSGSSCHPHNSSSSIIDTALIFPKLNFNASWISKKYFWHSTDFDFESRYKEYCQKIKRNEDIIKVIVLPHSHTDVGWLQTFEAYYHKQTKRILDNIADKLTKLPHMTFVWSELTYLSMYWEDASPATKQKFKKLIDEGRLEIATGGWVVPDEASTSLYALIQELTEGQQWIKNYLNITAQYSWAIDPFGHSSTHSHLLKNAGMKGMVIQRLHYGWKHWLAQHKKINFRWRPRWDNSGSSDIPCLTNPFDLYSIKHACGPDPQVCLRFDFRSILFEYGESYQIMTPITKRNVKKLSEELVAQYQKTASLTEHNIILVPLGDDFRYDHAIEFEQQYANYMQLFSYINSHKHFFNMEIGFGTLTEYFEAVGTHYKEVKEELPVLSGDFFPYGDVYVSGTPSYWTGFYGTRPYWKKLHRLLENELRTAEILFTYANAISSLKNSFVEIKTLNYRYQDLKEARHDFSLFSHHDGITGTSRRWVMEDYGNRLHDASLNCINLQIQCLKLIYKHVANANLPSVTKDLIWDNFEYLPGKVPIEVVFEGNDYITNIIVFNQLGWTRTEALKVLVKNSSVMVFDVNGLPIPVQINPVLFRKEDGTVGISNRQYELVFIAKLDPLAFTIFKIRHTHENNADFTTLASIICEACLNLNETSFPTERNIQEGFKLKNSRTELHFRENGLLEWVDMPTENVSVQVSLSYGFYRPVNRASGAYLLKPQLQTERKFFEGLQEDEHQTFVVIKGPIESKVVSIYSTKYEIIIVNTTLFHSENDDLKGILLENFVDFTGDYSHKVEAFMRFDTNLNSTNRVQSENQTQEQRDVPVMYTDQNGLVSERRVNQPSIQYEGNTYPVTTMAYIQDEDTETRFSILVDRAHGFNSMKSGRLESLIERRSMYDDGRGLSQSVDDSKPTVSSYIILLEKLKETGNGTDEIKDENFIDWQPTLHSHQSSTRLNYPPHTFVFNEAKGDNSSFTTEEMQFSLISQPPPPDLHIVNFRTLSKVSQAPREEEIAENQALLNLRYFLYRDNNQKSCNYSEKNVKRQVLHFISSAEERETSKIETQSIFHSKYLNVIKALPATVTGSMELETNNSLSQFLPNSLLSNFKLYFLQK